VTDESDVGVAVLLSVAGFAAKPAWSPLIGPRVPYLANVWRAGCGTMTVFGAVRGFPPTANFAPMFFDVAEAPSLYARLQHLIVSQLSSLSDVDAQTAVPTCPGWSVKDVMAHVSGLVAETLAGVPLPRGSDEATARQVNDRAELSLAQLCCEWVGNADAFAALGDEDPTYVAALTCDLVVHAIDISEALDRPIDIDIEAVQRVASRYGASLQQRAIEAGCMLTLVLDDIVSGDGPSKDPAEASSGNDDSKLVLRSSSHEFLRAVTGRRSGAQVRAMDWTGNPELLLANGWSQYGSIKD
jgi:uncharacterized protein (TIGR03083 family)